MSINDCFFVYFEGKAQSNMSKELYDCICKKNILQESSFNSSHVLVWILADLRQNIVLYISHPLINCFWPR